MLLYAVLNYVAVILHSSVLFLSCHVMSFLNAMLCRHVVKFHVMLFHGLSYQVV